MKKKIQINNFLSNMFLLIVVTSATWITAKAARLWILYISSRQFFTDSEWAEVVKFTATDRYMFVVMCISLTFYIIFNKIMKNKIK